MNPFDYQAAAADAKSAEKYLEFKKQKEHGIQSQQRIVAASKPPVIHRATAPVAAAKPSPAPSGLTTAAAFAIAPPIMARAEFVKLSAADKTRFVKAKGKLV